MIEVRYRNRLGNNLFQYALGRILAEEKGYALKAAPIAGFPNTRQPVHGAAHEKPRRLFRKVQVIEFADLLADPTPQRLILDGWFQRGEYYWPYRDRILKWFEKDPAIQMPDFHPELIVHVRRTDYLYHGWALPFSYYEEAIERLNPSGSPICILTDDATDPFFRLFDHWKPQFYHGNMLQEFWLMSQTPRLVLSQSKFSWWAAFLAESQITVCPAPAFGCWRARPDKMEVNLVDRERFICIECPEPYQLTPDDLLRARYLRRFKHWLARVWNRA